MSHNNGSAEIELALAVNKNTNMYIGVQSILEAAIYTQLCVAAGMYVTPLLAAPVAELEFASDNTIGTASHIEDPTNNNINTKILHP